MDASESRPRCRIVAKPETGPQKIALPPAASPRSRRDPSASH